jgi:hypothetical protein
LGFEAKLWATAVHCVTTWTRRSTGTSSSAWSSSSTYLGCGRGSKCLVLCDNEAGKGDHRHVMGRKEPYRFVSVTKLRRDFAADVRKYEGGNEEED